MLHKKTALAILALACIAAPISAQFIGRTVTVAQLPACNGTRQVSVVTDATNATTLGTGGGSATVWVTCATGSWTIASIAAVSDLSGYALLGATTTQNFTPGTNWSVTPVAGSATLNSVGAGKDVSLVSADDVFLTPADALVAVAGGNTTITSTAGTIALSSSAGSVTIGAVGATQDVTVSATDDVILSPTDALTLSGTTATLNAGGGAVEQTTAAGSTVFIGLVQITKAAAPPVACAAGVEGGLYMDSDTHLLCVCNASAWVQVADGTTGCS